MNEQPRSRQEVERRRVVVLRVAVVLSLLITAFWSCDRAGLFYGRLGVMGVPLQTLWYAGAAWVPISSLAAILQTDRRNFVYLFAVCAANLNTGLCLLIAVS